MCPYEEIGILNFWIMKIKELREKILQANQLDWFKDIEAIIVFPSLKIGKNIKGISALYKFISDQADGWNSFENIPNEFQSSKNHFDDLKNRIIQFVNSQISQANTRDLENYWKHQIGNRLSMSNIFPFDEPETEFLLKVFQEKSEYFKGAYNAIISSNINSNNRNDLFGGILAYEFLSKDQIDLIERRKSEKKSLSTLRNSFQRFFNESEENLLEHLKNNDKNFQAYSQKIDDLKEEKDKNISDWFTESQEKFSNFDEASKNKILDLEKAYQEKLKLAEPAKYWEEKAEKLKNQGWWTLIILVVLILLISFSLGCILWNSPAEIYSSWFGDDKSSAIRWTIVYITLISFMAFGIRAIGKVMFSSFHLARDAEERHTLTFFYLSLLKDSNVADDDRKLIMQSLFSRADTGLLKDDSSPAMPNDFVGKLFGNK